MSYYPNDTPQGYYDPCADKSQQYGQQYQEHYTPLQHYQPPVQGYVQNFSHDYDHYDAAQAGQRHTAPQPAQVSSYSALSGAMVPPDTAMNRARRLEREYKRDVPTYLRGTADKQPTVKLSYILHGKERRFLAQNLRNWPSMTFVSNRDKPGEGVSLSSCLYRDGTVLPEANIKLLLPIALMSVKIATFTMTWPGYPYVPYSERQSIAFVHSNGVSFSQAEFMRSIAGLYHQFLSSPGKFTGQGVRIGSNGGVKFDELRLCGMWTEDGGRTWQAEVSYLASHGNPM